MLFFKDPKLSGIQNCLWQLFIPCVYPISVWNMHINNKFMFVFLLLQKSILTKKLWKPKKNSHIKLSLPVLYWATPSVMKSSFVSVPHAGQTSTLLRHQTCNNSTIRKPTLPFKSSDILCKAVLLYGYPSHTSQVPVL